MKRFILQMMTAFAFTLLAVPAQADSPLMNSMKTVNLCHYTVPSDYDSITTQGKEIGTSNLITIRFDIDALNNSNCYIYQLPAKPNTFVTVHPSPEIKSMLVIRWSTPDEISYAFSNSTFKHVRKGVFRAELTQGQ